MLDTIHKHYHYYESPLEVCDYDPKKDNIAIFVGNGDDIPPREVFEKIKEQLESIKDECKLLVAPEIFRIVVMKGKK